MADVSKFTLTKGTKSDTIDTSEAQAAAAAMTVDYTGAKQVLLYVLNNDAAVDAYVSLTAPTTNATGGVKRSQGAVSYECPFGEELVINLSDTARYLNLSDKDIDIALVDSTGTALEAAVLSDITIRTIEL